MERKKASDFPSEVLRLFDGYVHGSLSRRDFIDRAAKFAVGGFTAAAMLRDTRAPQPERFNSVHPEEAWQKAPFEGPGLLRHRLHIGTGPDVHFCQCDHFLRRKAGRDFIEYETILVPA